MSFFFRTKQKLGNWLAKTNNTVYQAINDGDVHAVGNLAAPNHTRGFTDNSNPPTTQRQGDNGDNAGSVTMKVRKGDYWKVENCNVTVFWIPTIP